MLIHIFTQRFSKIFLKMYKTLTYLMHKAHLNVYKLLVHFCYRFIVLIN